MGRAEENHSISMQDKCCVCFFKTQWGLHSVLQMDLQSLCFVLVLSALGFIFSACVGTMGAITDGITTTLLTL